MAYGSAAMDALGDPTRRRILEVLRDGEHSVRELTDATDVSQPAVSQHLRVLKGAGLVEVRPAGARRLYSINPGGLADVRAWVDSFWDDALDAFVQHANSTPPGRTP
ncbi:ArsR/SmtB family transcription factor [Nostocoides australiense]|uniref:HTH transcriptional regulator, ArsR family n=1 Tax=Nostocoides australiense Ben110 TaxID=1193182 RepID=W6JWZ4_9MICO|nr:metalloregulator ArsR/SmtB family transcription factor [Tetrasphaera australiensis]CCH73271.1 HTH transcriptional regulator, ArsR family [Tetrasphaera australiensis Ben110]HRW03380.1 metalloregulator ArsR/SmtB family transcription factor [Tetrasphaera sp.]